MVALNFSPQFAPEVESGQKRQSIRQTAVRFKPGCEIQFFVGQRTKWCRKLGIGICRDVTYVGLTERGVTLGDKSRFPSNIDEFARADGFKDYTEMWEWFHYRYNTNSFTGYVIRWDPA